MLLKVIFLSYPKVKTLTIKKLSFDTGKHTPQLNCEYGEGSFFREQKEWVPPLFALIEFCGLLSIGVWASLRVVVIESKEELSNGVHSFAILLRK